VEERGRAVNENETSRRPNETLAQYAERLGQLKLTRLTDDELKQTLDGWIDVMAAVRDKRQAEEN
jgi:hypothetical protein